MNQDEPTVEDILGADNHELRCLIAVHIEGREAWVNSGGSILLRKPLEDPIMMEQCPRLPEVPPFDLISSSFIPDWPRNMRKTWGLLWNVMRESAEDEGSVLTQSRLGDWFCDNVVPLWRLSERTACTRICQAVLLAHFGYKLVPWPE